MGHFYDTRGINRGSIGTGSITSRGRKVRVTSTNPKVKLTTQTIDVIYSALFEGDMTRQLVKIISFSVRIFMFFDFFWNFSYLKILKKNKGAYSIQLGGIDFCRQEK